MKREHNSRLNHTDLQILAEIIAVNDWIHGFEIAEHLRKAEGKKRRMGPSTLYSSLNRMEKAGLLTSKWEDLNELKEGRPRRRYYRINGAGQLAFEASVQELSDLTRRLVPLTSSGVS